MLRNMSGDDRGWFLDFVGQTGTGLKCFVDSALEVTTLVTTLKNIVVQINNCTCGNFTNINIT